MLGAPTHSRVGGEGVDAMVNNATVRIHPGGWVVYSTSQVNVVGFIVQVMLCICVSLDAELDCNGARKSHVTLDSTKIVGKMSQWPKKYPETLS